MIIPRLSKPLSAFLPEKLSIYTPSLGLRGILVATVFSLSSLLAGCGGGTGTSSDPVLQNDSPAVSDTASLEKGELLISITDAEGDFLSYSVDLTAINLVHRNGSEVSVLPSATTVDFAQYVDISELLSVASVPLGAYESVTIGLDFSDAQITVQNEAGEALEAVVIGADGVALAETTVAIKLSGKDHLVLNRGRRGHITLDFDLDASNEITITDSGATVTVQPVFLADTLHQEAKPFRLRGLLDTVDLDESLFTLAVRPMYKRDGEHGQASVSVDENTRYEINGEIISSESGLAALAELETESAALVAKGNWNKENETFVATDIKAGSSVAWNDKDLMRGTVVARDGNIITVRGGSLETRSSHRHAHFNDDISLSISDSTIITKSGEQAEASDISVGSFVQASGELDSSGQLDASNGFVRVAGSKVSGRVVSADSELVVDVAKINGRRVSIFDFSGTGASAEQDADPTAYEIDTGSIALDTIAADDPIRLHGYVTPFGTAPSDFIAASIANAANVRSHLNVSYGRTASANAVESNTEEGLLLNLADAERHFIFSTGIPLDLSELESMPLIVPAAEQGIYTIEQAKSFDVYQAYSDFVAALDELIAAGALVSHFDAQGYYHSETAQFESQRLRIAMVIEE
ncbi:protein of unknown function [Alteromonadaceae bacterium Bs31]|nr:protein of unknown function [Alteromonadaceae bacterium Bs31]